MRQWKSSLGRCCVRIQWVPERDRQAHVVPNARSLQIGLSGEALDLYINERVIAIDDVTHDAIHQKKMMAENSSVSLEILRCYRERIIRFHRNYER
jgi:Domain of unknown function (DUF4291)